MFVMSRIVEFIVEAGVCLSLDVEMLCWSNVLVHRFGSTTLTLFCLVCTIFWVSLWVDVSVAALRSVLAICKSCHGSCPFFNRRTLDPLMLLAFVCLQRDLSGFLCVQKASYNMPVSCLLNVINHCISRQPRLSNSVVNQRRFWV